MVENQITSKSPQELFLEELEKNGSMTGQEAIDFGRRSPETWFGPNRDGIDLLGALVWRGIAKFTGGKWVLRKK